MTESRRITYRLGLRFCAIAAGGLIYHFVLHGFPWAGELYWFLELISVWTNENGVFRNFQVFALCSFLFIAALGHTSGFGHGAHGLVLKVGILFTKFRYQRLVAVDKGVAEQGR